MTTPHPAGRSLSRAAGDGRAAAPVRLVHLGLGNFFRAHQAWYTDRAPDAADWGIAAFTGRSARPGRLADRPGRPLHADHPGRRGRPVRGGEQPDPGPSRRRPRRLAGLPRLRRRSRAVTITVTEAGYLRGADGGLDRDRPEIRADVAALRGDLAAPVRTAPARLVAGCAARRRADAGPLAAGLLRQPARQRRGRWPGSSTTWPSWSTRASPSGWPRRVSFVTTMVDRITPRTTPDDRRRGGRRHGPRRLLPGRHRTLPRVGAQRRLPRRAARLGGRRRHDHRRHRALRAPQALAAQRRALAAGLRRLRSRAPDRRRGGGRRRLPGAGCSSGGTRRHATSTCPRPTSRPTAPRCSTGSPTRGCTTGSPRSPPTAPRSCRSASCRSCARSGPPVACPRARPGCWPPGCATCAAPARRWTTSAPSRWSRSPTARCPTPSGVCSTRLDPELGADDELVKTVLADAKRLSDEPTGGARP